MLRQIFVALSAVLLFAQMAHAEIRVDVTSGNVQPMPIALVDFAGSSMGAQITQVVQNDLRSSGLFAPIPSSAFIERTLDVNTAPRFPDWRVVNAQALVVGQASEQGDKVSVDFRLWDVLAEQQMVGRRFTTSRANWRQLAHMVADAIYTRLTGEEGYFNTRVVYVAESGPWNAKVKRLAIMDQDGANNRYLTAGGNLVLTPRFSPNQQQITYMSYERGAPAVYLYDLSSGRHQRLGNFPGMTSAPRFNPKGNGVVMSMSRGGVTNIYSMPIGGSPRQLTNTRAISTAPSYSPDGARITFESDRSGTQQIYTMNADGSNQTRISFGKGRYASPVWSPRGDLIAFVKMNTGDGQFYIGVMRPDGSGERLISSAYHAEGPTWAPNGRVLMYFKETPSSRGRQAQLYSIDLTGANEVRVNTAGAASDPAWGPRLN